MIEVFVDDLAQVDIWIFVAATVVALFLSVLVTCACCRIVVPKNSYANICNTLTSGCTQIKCGVHYYVPVINHVQRTRVWPTFAAVPHETYFFTDTGASMAFRCYLHMHPDVDEAQYCLDATESVGADLSNKPYVVLRIRIHYKVQESQIQMFSDFVQADAPKAFNDAFWSTVGIVNTMRERIDLEMKYQRTTHALRSGNKSSNLNTISFYADLRNAITEYSGSDTLDSIIDNNDRMAEISREIELASGTYISKIYFEVDTPKTFSPFITRQVAEAVSETFDAKTTDICFQIRTSDGDEMGQIPVDARHVGIPPRILNQISLQHSEVDIVSHGEQYEIRILVDRTSDEAKRSIVERLVSMVGVRNASGMLGRGPAAIGGLRSEDEQRLLHPGPGGLGATPTAHVVNTTRIDPTRFRSFCDSDDDA